MIKILMTVTLLATLGFARMIGGVAITVDNEPITLHEIETFQKQNHISKEEAVNALIQKKLEDQAIANSGIFVTPLEIDQETELFAQQNGVDINGLKEGLAKQGTSLETFKKNVGEKLKRNKLYKKVLAGRLKKADDATLRAYYEAHKKEFMVPGNIDVMEYHSKKGENLQAKMMQPMLNVPDLSVKERAISVTQVNPKLFALLLKTPEKSFTQIIKTPKDFIMFFVKQKHPNQTIDFEKAKQNIFARVMREREQALIIEYFEKKKAEAIVKVIRKP